MTTHDLQPVETPREFEVGAKQSYRDALFSLLRSAAENPGRPAECHATEAVRELFVQSPIVIGSALFELDTGRRIRGSAAIAEAGEGTPRVMEASEFYTWIGGIDDELETHGSQIDPNLRTALLESDGRWVMVMGRRPNGCLIDVEERIYVVAGSEWAAPASADRRDWFYSYIPGMRDFYVTLKALHTADHHAELEREIALITRERTDQPFARVLTRAAEILEQLVYEVGCDDPQQQYLVLADRLARWAVHQALGSGWLTAPDTKRGNRAVRSFAHGLARIASIADNPDLPKASAVIAHRLRIEALTLDPSPDRPPDQPRPQVRRPRAWRNAMDAVHPSTTPVGAAEWLLGVWTGVHAAVSRYETMLGNTGENEEALWAWAADRSGGLIGKMLQEGGTQVETSRLSLWFALQLLPRTVGDDAIGTRRRRWRIRTRLAWVLRESLRRVVDGRRSDYAWQPERWVDSMYELIETHAKHVLQVPSSFDVRGSLTAFGVGDDLGDRRLLRGHRRHTIEVYLTGNFLLGLHRQMPDGSERTVAQLLASPDDGEATEDQVRDLRTAYGLAALHHDVGMLVLERISDLNPWPASLGVPRASLEAFRSSRAEERREFLEGCIDDLGKSGLLGSLDIEDWSPDDDTGEHALVSAWILYHLGKDGNLSPEVLGAAVRAVLLHGEVTQEIDISHDPAASLLVLADQLFEWEPLTHALPMKRGKARRTREINIQGLSIDFTLQGPHARIQHQKYWPAFVLDLHHADVAGIPTWFTWLSLAQSLGRIKTRHHGWNPSIVLRSPVDAHLTDRGLDTYQLLDRCSASAEESALRPLALALQDWLAREAQFKLDPKEGVEVLILHPLDTDKDVRVGFPLLRATIERMLAQADALLP